LHGKADRGGRCASQFQNYKAAWAENAYPAALCVSVNDEIVHGMPDINRQLFQGDIVGLMRPFYQGLYRWQEPSLSDRSAAGEKLLSVTQAALLVGIRKIKPGRKLSGISRRFKQDGEGRFSVVRQLCGHGVVLREGILSPDAMAVVEDIAGSGHGFGH
jgi:methionyl aminopeptidase